MTTTLLPWLAMVVAAIFVTAFLLRFIAQLAFRAQCTWKQALPSGAASVGLAIVFGGLSNAFAGTAIAYFVGAIGLAAQILLVGLLLGSKARTSDGAPLGLKRAAITQLLTLLALMVSGVLLSLILPKN
jgi:hypothetical protein